MGAVEDAVMYTASKTKDILIVRTVSNVLAGKSTFKLKMLESFPI